MLARASIATKPRQLALDEHDERIDDNQCRREQPRRPHPMRERGRKDDEHQPKYKLKANTRKDAISDFTLSM
jgi:hypothetical protein